MATFEKAKKKTNKKWYIITTKNYCIPIYFLFPACFVILYDKIKIYLTSRIYDLMKWTDEKAKKFLTKVFQKY